MSESTAKKPNPKYYWILSFFLGAVSMYVMLSYAQMLSTGKYIVLGGDSFSIFISNLRMYAANIRQGGNFWYSFACCMGLNLSLNMAEKAFSPFNLLYLIFPNGDVNTITAAIIIAKTGLAAATFQLFASMGLKVRGLYSILFSVFYALCSFVAIYGIICFMWLDGIYMLPLVALGIHKAVKEEKVSLLTFSYAYIFIVQFYMGYMIGVFSLFYFVLLMATGKKEERALSTKATVGKYILSGVTGILVSAVVWVPVVLFLKNFYATDSTAFEKIEITLMQVFNNLFWGESQNYYLAPYVYCGIPALLLLPFFFGNKKIAVSERIVYGVLLAFYVIGCIFLPVFQFLHAFEAPDMWNFRFSYIISFLLCIIAMKAVDGIEKITWKPVLAYVAFLIVFYLVEGRIEKMEIGSLSHNTLMGFLLNVAWIGLWILIAYFYKNRRKQKSGMAALILFLAAAEVVTNGCMRLCSDEWHNALTREDEFYEWEGRMNDVSAYLSEIETDGDFYRTLVCGDLNKNSDAYFNYNGLVDFGTAENENVRHFLQDMGFYAFVRRTSATGCTAPMEMLFDVKYSVQLQADAVYGNYETPILVNENEIILPIAFVTGDGAIAEIEMGENAFENQNALFEALSGVKELYTPVPYEKISTTEEGLALVEGTMGPVFMETGEGNGEMIMQVTDTENPVYVLVTSDGPPEEITGVYYQTLENMAFFEDNSAWIPFIAKMRRDGDVQKIVFQSIGNFEIAFQTTGVDVYELNRDKLAEVYDVLSKESFSVGEYKNGFVKGSVSTSENNRILVTTIPYEEGWKVSANGRELRTVPVLNGAFLGVVLPEAGEYEITFDYHCPGARIGMITTLFGVLLFGVILFSELRKKTEKHSEKNETEETRNEGEDCGA